ncbi:glycosyltransferase family 2 protein [Rubritepida flocculans]|uniref:glycosyltransferase family 2 protein n=1 Tax=Rubritepida flocculans TaxID=182403 RepID=UPI000427B0E6|nr:glycosyltransferase family 2 protein [Rubritepida flocculans]
MTTPSPAPAEGELELTILMPCLNEAETLALCIRDAQAFLARSGVRGEVLVADNGSTDGSQAIAESLGARVVPVAERGYGAALRGGIAAARGRFVIMGDSDHSYDFANLDAFVEALRGGAELVMGNRFRGGIEKGAMPFLHRWLGNPVLSFLGRLFFRVPTGDFHCGIRGFSRERILALNLVTPGMEFASEMVVRAALAGYRIAEVPTRLRPDGRSRPPHLRTWRDGWRHLRFLLFYSPRWLFLYPGLALLGLGAGLVLLLAGGPVVLGPVRLDLHSLMAGCLFLLAGMQAVAFALISRLVGMRRGYLPPMRESWWRRLPMLESGLILAALLLLAGVAGMAATFGGWAGAGFGDIEDPVSPRLFLVWSTVAVAGLQLGFTAFLASILEAGQEGRG